MRAHQICYSCTMDDRAPRRPNRSVWSQAARTLHILKGWQAIPAAILAVYLLVGILVPPEWLSLHAGDVTPPLGWEWDTGKLLVLGSDRRYLDLFDYTLWGATQIARYAVPAVLLGVAVGWTAAHAVSRLSFRMRYSGSVAFGGTVALRVPARAT